MRLHSFYSIGGGTLFLLALFLTGCEQMKLPEAVNQQVKNAGDNVNKAAEPVKQLLTPKSGIDLTTVPPLQAANCFVRWEAPRGGRSGVLSLSSSPDGVSESFPAIYARADLQFSSLAEADGKVVSAQMYAQRESGGAVLRSPRGEPVQLKLSKLEGGSLLVEVMRGTLVDQETSDVTTVGGKFIGRMP